MMSGFPIRVVCMSVFRSSGTGGKVRPFSLRQLKIGPPGQFLSHHLAILEHKEQRIYNILDSHHFMSPFFSNRMMGRL